MSAYDEVMNATTIDLGYAPGDTASASDATTWAGDMVYGHGLDTLRARTYARCLTG